MTEEKTKRKLKNLTGFHSVNRFDNYNRARGEGEGRGKKKKKSNRIYRTSQDISIIDVFLESLLSESFPSLGVTVHISLGCPPTLC